MKYTRQTIAALAASLVAGVGIAATATAPAQAADDVYTPPATISGAPGTILKQKDGVYAFDNLGISKLSTKTILYVSTGAKGNKTAVSGSVIVPKAAWTKGGERPIVSVAPGTQGINDKCAPSKLATSAQLYDGNWIKQLLDAGYAVAMTDYEGLGTPGVHPYANNIALGQNTLDVVRAAQNLGYSKTAPVFVTGFSEGGGATAGALELAPTYAPDLNIKAGLAVAPTTDLAKIAPNIETGLYTSFLLFAVKGLDSVYPELNLTALTNDKGENLLNNAETVTGCLPENLTNGWLDTKTLTKEGKTISSYLTRPDIAATLGTLKEGTKKVNVPFKVLSSWGDDVIPNAAVKDAAKGWCSKGSPVSYGTLVAPTHVASGYEGMGQAVGFFNDRVAGKPFVSNCLTSLFW